MKIQDLIKSGAGFLAAYDAEKSQLRYFSKEVMENWLWRNLKDGDLIEVYFKKHNDNKSLQQLRYYWGVVIPTIRAFLKESEGKVYDPEDIHQYNMCEIMGYKQKEVELFGKVVIVSERTRLSKATKEEFQDIKTHIQAYYAEIGCDIPDPNERNFLNA